MALDHSGRIVQTEVRNPLTDEILFGTLEQGGTVRIGLSEDSAGLVFSYEATVEEEAPATDTREADIVQETADE